MSHFDSYRLNFNNSSNNGKVKEHVARIESNPAHLRSEENKFDGENKFTTSTSLFSASASRVKCKPIDKIDDNNGTYDQCSENTGNGTTGLQNYEKSTTTATNSISSSKKDINNKANFGEESSLNSALNACQFINDDPQLQQQQQQQEQNQQHQYQQNQNLHLQQNCRLRNNGVSCRMTNSVAPYIPQNLQYTVAYQQPVCAMNNIRAPTKSFNKKKNVQCKIQMFRFLEVAIKRILFHLAKAATQHKILFRIFPMFLSCLPLIALWYIRGKIQLSTPIFDLLLPDSIPSNVVGSQQLSATVAALSATGSNFFNGSNPMFDAPRQSSSYDYSIILSTRSQFDNILTNRSLAVYKNLFNQMRNISVTHSLGSFKWNDMCRESCNEQNIIAALQGHQLLLKYPEAIVIKTIKNEKNFSNSLNIDRVFLANIVGDVELDSDGIITRARSLLLNIKLKESINLHTLATFENQLRKIVKNFSIENGGNNDNLVIYFWSFRNYISEVLQSFLDIHIKIIFSGLLFVCMTCGIGLNTCNSYKNRPFVALQIVFITVISIGLIYVVHLIGADGVFNMALFPVIFVFCAISILFFSSIRQCFLRYSMAALDPTEKLAFIYSWDIPCFVGCAIASSISTASSAWFTENSYLRQSLLALAVGTITLMVFGIFYLTVFWYTSEKREASGLKWFQICQKGDETFNNKFVLDYDELICDHLHQKLTDLKSNFSRLIGRIVANYNLRTISVVLFTVYMIFAGLGLFSMDRKIELREEYFIRSYSTNQSQSSAAYLNKRKSAFEKYEDYLELSIDVPFDYYNKQNKERIFELLRWALDNNYATKAVSWLVDFERFRKSTVYDVNMDTIVPLISYVFLKNDLYRKYSTDIVFDRFQTQILKSRMYLELSAKGLSSSDILMKELEKRAKAANIPLSLNAPYSFLPRHDRQTFTIAFSTFAILVACLTASSFVFFTHPVISFCIPLSCIFVSTGVCGLAHHFGIPLNIITFTTAIIGNLLTSSVTIHFCYMFCNAGISQNTNIKRMEYSFQCTLWPTFLSCCSMSILFLPLLFNNSPLLLHIWKMLTVISIITFLNYLFVLPSLTIIINDYISLCSSSLNNFCDSSSGCCVAEQTSNGIYFIPGRNNAITAPPSRSFASYYIGKYMVDDSLMLPPTYDYSQQMIMGPTALPSLPPPPLPLTQDQSQPQGDYNASLEDNGRVVGRLLYHHQQSPRQRRALDNYDQYVIREVADSNCDSLDSRTANLFHRRQLNNECANNTASAASSRHQTPRRNRREFVSNSAASSSNLPSRNLQHANNNNTSFHSKEQQQKASSQTNEQIYEEPESPILIRRSQSDGRRRNATYNNSTKQTKNLSTRMSCEKATTPRSFYHNNKRGVINKKLVSNKPESNVQPTWRQYLLEGSIFSSLNSNNKNLAKKQSNNKNSSDSHSMPYIVSSPPSNRRKYRF